MRRYKDNVIVNMTFEFALGIIDFTDVLIEQRRFALEDQIIKSGCSIGANVRESQGAESKADLVHKMKVALKEAEESEYWLELCEFAKNLPKPGKLLIEIESIIKGFKQDSNHIKAKFEMRSNRTIDISAHRLIG